MNDISSPEDFVKMLNRLPKSLKDAFISLKKVDWLVRINEDPWDEKPWNTAKNVTKWAPFDEIEAINLELAYLAKKSSVDIFGKEYYVDLKNMVQVNKKDTYK